MYRNRNYYSRNYFEKRLVKHKVQNETKAFFISEPNNKIIHRNFICYFKQDIFN